MNKLIKALPLGGFWLSTVIFSLLISLVYFDISNEEDLYWAWDYYYQSLELRKEVGGDVYAICKDGTVFEDYKANEIGGGCWNSKHGGSYYEKFIIDDELKSTPDQRVISEKISLLFFYLIGLFVLVDKAKDLHKFFFDRKWFR